MQSINNLTAGARSMNGLNTISANNVDADSLDVDVLIVNSAGTVPTRIAGDNTTNIANTAFVTAAVAGAGTNYVTLTTAQTVSGNKNFTGTNILGDVFSVDQPVKTSITNNTVSDTNINGTIGGEAVYHQFRMGSRGTYWSQGVGSGNQYFGISGSGVPDPDVVLTINENGLKVSNGNTNDQTSFTEALKVIGTSRTTGIATFDVPPISATNPTTATQICNKQYTDSGNGASILSLNNTFTGNNVFNCATGTNSIRGNQLDIFPTITYLTSPTTTISGTILNANSTQNWFNGDYTNLSGAIQTTMRSPTTLITSTSCQYFTNQASIQTAFTSPSFLITNNCTSFDIRATNTYLDNSVVTATTQASSDNSTKLATTAYVNNHVSSNYMTLATNQSVSGVKTYSTQQIFNAGTASSTYDNVSLTDMTIANNSANGILSISGGKITCDTFGVRASVGGNFQLNEGAFIQPNPSLAIGKEPVFTFGVNQVANFTATTTQATATKQINTTAFKYWCGNNQSTLFSLTHSLTNGYVIGPGVWEELEIYISWVDANTGITRLTSGNLATTGGFTMNPSATVIRPTITFTLDTSTLPEAVYNINAFVKIQNAYITNALNSMTWNLSATPSTFTTTQNYNTPKDYTFTSRNLYHCFRNTAMCGVYIINNIATQQNIMTPIHYSITDFTNFTTQPSTSGALTTPAVTGGTVAGNFVGLSINNADNIYLVYPNYSLILYDTAGFSGAVYINFKNTSLNPISVSPSTTQRGSSCRIYFDEVELIKY